MIALFALLYAARAVLRPAPNDWPTTLRAGPMQMQVGVAALIQWGTTPWIARQLHGRSLPTRLGDMQLSWDDATQKLRLQCQPCTLRSCSWGGEPLRFQAVQMTVRRTRLLRQAGRPTQCRAGGLAGGHATQPNFGGAPLDSQRTDQPGARAMGRRQAAADEKDAENTNASRAADPIRYKARIEQRTGEKLSMLLSPK